MCSLSVTEEHGEVIIIDFFVAILITAAIFNYQKFFARLEGQDCEEEEDVREEEIKTEEVNSTHDLEILSDGSLEAIRDRVVAEDYNEKDTSGNKQKTKISEDVFNDFKRTSIALCRLIKSVCWKEDFLQLIRKLSNTNAEPTSYWFNLKSQLVKDILRCYQEMGYSPRTNFDTPQGQCLYVFTRLLCDEDELFDYSFQDIDNDMTFEEIKKEYIKNTNAQLKVYAEFGSETKSIKGRDDFNLVFVYGVYDDKIEQYYRMLIFRFCQLVAKCDKKITRKKITWLKTILHNEMLQMYNGEEDEEKPDWIKSAQVNLENVSFAKRNTSKSNENSIEFTSESLTALSELIGLKEAKSEIASLINYIQMKKKRDEFGMKSPNISYHCVFTGNPGTGKTTVARIIADIYRDLGVLSNGHLVETDRSGLVAEYVGQTAVKTNNIIDKALGGVLFIDEAYTLAQGGKDDYGQEAIATLIKRMEDDRDQFVVILAGYTNEIEHFINSNPGFRSRFNRYIHFEDYSADELYDIFILLMKKNEYTITEDASLYLKKLFSSVTANKPHDFGNARFVRNLFEKTVEAQANRLALTSELTKEGMAEIIKSDIAR